MRLGADQHVTFFGYVPHEQISHYFHENDVSILVSSYEGFCLGLAEAMSYGLPGVAFSCGGVINDYLLDGETGYLVGQGDTAAFADRLTLLLDPQRYEKLSKNAQTITSEHFNQDSIAERYRAILACTDDLSSGAWPGLRPPLANKNKIEMIIERVGCRLLKWPTLSSHQLDH
jgi:glycosyltransferase involved in cell wall biosynthesis